MTKDLLCCISFGNWRTRHTGKDVIAGKRYTEEECQELLDADLKNAIDTVERNVKVPLSTIQKASLASFVYNVGNTAFENSTLLKKLNAADIQGACDEMRRWKYDEGKVSKGLMNRRTVEQELCKTQLESFQRKNNYAIR